MKPPTWMREAACAYHPDPDMWFAHALNDKPRHDSATAICLGCPVRWECLAYARAERIDHGIWGGMTPAERCGRGRPRKEIIHGTYNGYRIHHYRREEPCDACKAGAKSYEQNRRVAT